MNIRTLLLLLSLSSVGLNAQDASEPIDLDEVIVIEEQETAEATEAEPFIDLSASVVNLDEASPLGEPPVIPVAQNALPDETEVVLELPGQEPQLPGSVDLATEETISVDFPDEDVRTILRNVADLFDLNLIIPQTLQGRTSIKLRDITWKQVFEVVLEPLGFTFVEENNIIRIKSVEELAREPVDTEVFIIEFAQAQEIQGSIQPLVDASAGGLMQVDTRSNALVITERPSRIIKIREIIDKLDKPTAQVMIESKFIEVTEGDVKNIGVNWASMSGYTIAGGPFRRDWSRTREQSLESSAINQSENVDTNGFSSQGGVLFDNLDTQTLGAGQILSGLASTGRIDTAVLSAQDFRLILSALESENNAKLVANPTIVTMDNVPASISIITEEERPAFFFNPETGTRESNGRGDSITYGTTINVRPQVNSAGFINLEIEPEVSNQIGSTPSDQGPLPILSVRKAKSSVTIKDGFTVALGGMVESNEVDTETRVPVLGDLPGVGRLFRSSEGRVSQRNLIIFITAKTLNPDGTTYREIVDPRLIDQMGITSNDVPGYEISPEHLEILSQLENIRNEAALMEKLETARQVLEKLEEAKQKAEEEALSQQEESE